MSVAQESNFILVGEERIFSVSFVKKLDIGELLTGVPTVEEQNTGDLTISNEAVSTSVLTINGVSVPAGQAVQFKALGALEDIDYLIKVTCNTDSTPTQVLKGSITVSGIA